MDGFETFNVKVRDIDVLVRKKGEGEGREKRKEERRRKERGRRKEGRKKEGRKEKEARGYLVYLFNKFSFCF